MNFGFDQAFGLGNKQYEHFNKTGRDTNRFLTERGGTSVYPYGEGDDDAKSVRQKRKFRKINPNQPNKNKKKITHIRGLNVPISFKF